ncbi:MAG: hypothetical protein HY356_06470 [Gammaproteobacteria bacterium]|nr:hypothetical protein [Gammaproteobacteria bacterium]
MPQFIFKDDNQRPALWLDLLDQEGNINQFSNLHINWDENYILEIEPLKEGDPEQGFDNYLSRINEYLCGAENEALRILKKYGVTEHEISFGVIAIRLMDDGSVPAGVYAAARIIELITSFRRSLENNDINIYDAHTLAMIVQLSLGKMDYLKNNLEQYIISEKNRKAAKKRAGNVGIFKHAIVRICQKINSKSYEDFINAISDDSENMNDSETVSELYEQLTDRINIHHFQNEGGYLKFQTRDGKDDKRKLTTVRNILSKINL